MTDLREAMLTDLRARGVMLMSPDRRSFLVDEMIEDGVTTGQWRSVIAYLDEVCVADLPAAQALLGKALAVRATWTELLESAQDRERIVVPQSTQAPNEDSRVVSQRPVSNCDCGGHVTDWFEQRIDGKRRDEDQLSVLLHGRWFCTSCGSEWTASGKVKGFPFGGHTDPSTGLPIPQPEPKTKPKKKPKPYVPKDDAGKDVPEDKRESYWNESWDRVLKGAWINPKGKP